MYSGAWLARKYDLLNVFNDVYGCSFPLRIIDDLCNLVTVCDLSLCVTRVCFV